MVCYNKEKQVIYIHVPKTGGMSIERLLIDNFGFVNFNFEKGPYEFLNNNEGTKGFLRYIMLYSKESKIYDLSSWKKFTFVRNPYSRIKSGIRYLIEEHLSTPPDTMGELYSLCETKPFFYNHVILNQVDTVKDLEGKVNYGFVGKFENYDQDLKYALFNFCGFEERELPKYHIHKTNKEVVTLDDNTIHDLTLYHHLCDFNEFGYAE